MELPFTLVSDEAFDMLLDQRITCRQWFLHIYISTFPGRGKVMSIPDLAKLQDEIADGDVIDDLKKLESLGLLDDHLKKCIEDYK